MNWRLKVQFSSSREHSCVLFDCIDRHRWLVELRSVIHISTVYRFLSSLLVNLRKKVHEQGPGVTPGWFRSSAEYHERFEKIQDAINGLE